MRAATGKFLSCSTSLSTCLCSRPPSSGTSDMPMVHQGFLVSSLIRRRLTVRFCGAAALHLAGDFQTWMGLALTWVLSDMVWWVSSASAELVPARAQWTTTAPWVQTASNLSRASKFLLVYSSSKRPRWSRRPGGISVVHHCRARSWRTSQVSAQSSARIGSRESSWAS